MERDRMEFWLDSKKGEDPGFLLRTEGRKAKTKKGFLGQKALFR
jgi:hypothetical protein